jgi:hypothetical protein
VIAHNRSNVERQAKVKENHPAPGLSDWNQAQRWNVWNDRNGPPYFDERTG